MKVFNNLEEMKPYYNEEINTYIFSENNRLIDIKIDFDLNIKCNINALDIKARNITALDINAWDINSRDINACDINADNINAWDIKARNINSGDINAWNIKARDIEACDINACEYINARNIKSSNINAWNINVCDIEACDINAGNINANKISFYAVCFAYKTFVCNTIRGIRENSKYFCLDSDVVIKNQKS